MGNNIIILASGKRIFWQDVWILDSLKKKTQAIENITKTFYVYFLGLFWNSTNFHNVNMVPSSILHETFLCCISYLNLYFKNVEKYGKN